ncbi:hypothetical protein Dsin_018760 [Dipteronia sinensis]|uniref:Uncharacterized protein n=1 Tax=Dipteronia sinensis TaxID=43782 RepID=A0AAE0A6R8_9ROSI|nr:hypothetical protein Dsin_018760 [Dipteronia sinensis]
MEVQRQLKIDYLRAILVEADSGTLIPDAIGKFISFRCIPMRDDGIVEEPRTCLHGAGTCLAYPPNYQGSDKHNVSPNGTRPTPPANDHNNIGQRNVLQMALPHLQPLITTTIHKMALPHLQPLITTMIHKMALPHLQPLIATQRYLDVYRALAFSFLQAMVVNYGPVWDCFPNCFWSQKCFRSWSGVFGKNYGKCFWSLLAFPAAEIEKLQIDAFRNQHPGKQK